MAPIRFYKTRGEFGAFSNFAPYAVAIDGVRYRTTEHFYQSQKFEGTDPKHQRLIATITRAGDAARLGRDRTKPLREDWEEVKISIMRRAISAKAAQNSEVLELLMSTGDREIIEDSPRDYYWGCGADGTGENRLGRLWMELREFLQEAEIEMGR